MGINNRENIAINQIQYNTIALLPGSNATACLLHGIWHTYEFLCINLGTVGFGMLQSLHCANCRSSIKNCCKLASLTMLANHEEQYYDSSRKHYYY